MATWARKEVRSRREWLARIEARIRWGNPRLLMSAIVAVTAGAGMLASAVLHQVGLATLAVRYGLSVAFAYLVFILIIWMWVVAKRRSRIDDPGHDRGDLPGISPADGDLVVTETSDWPDPPRPLRRRYRLDLPDLGIDDEGFVVFVVVAAIVAAGAASVYTVIIAPQLLSEVLLDGVLATVIYRRLRVDERRHWLDSAVSRTWLPVMLVGIFFVIAGAVCQWYAPEATTLAEVFRHKPAP